MVGVEYGVTMMKVLQMFLSLVLMVLGALVASMFAVGKQVYKESDGKSVPVALTATVEANQLAVVDTWAGITNEDGLSGETITMDISQFERQLIVPSGLAVAKGDVIYVDKTDLTGHTPDDTAYSTSTGANKVAVMKATAAKDGNNVVTGIMFPFGQLVNP